MKKRICAVIAMGALWGISEATIGHVLHVFALGIGWLLWYPMAFFFLDTVYRFTKKPYCMLLAAGISSGLKMINLIHTPRIDYVVNPAVSILLEGLAAFAVYAWLEKRTDGAYGLRIGPVSVVAAGVLWRSAYICCLLLFMPESWIEISCLAGTAAFARFYILETAANAALICACTLAWRGLKAADKRKRLYPRRIDNPVFKPLPAVILLAAAVAVRIAL